MFKVNNKNNSTTQIVTYCYFEHISDLVLVLIFHIYQFLHILAKVHFFSTVVKKLQFIKILPSPDLPANNRNTRTRCELCSKLTIKTPKPCHEHRFGVFIVNFEHNSHIALVFLLLTLNK